MKGVNLFAEMVDFDDEQNVAGTRLFRPVLKVVKRKGDKADQKFNLEIGMLISKRLSEFDSLNDPEVNSFRRDTVPICQVPPICPVYGMPDADFVARMPLKVARAVASASLRSTSSRHASTTRPCQST